MELFTWLRMNGYSGGWDVIFPGLTCPATFLPSRWQPSSGEGRRGEGRGGEARGFTLLGSSEARAIATAACSAVQEAGGREAESHPLTHPTYSTTSLSAMKVVGLHSFFRLLNDAVWRSTDPRCHSCRFPRWPAPLPPNLHLILISKLLSNTVEC